MDRITNNEAFKKALSSLSLASVLSQKFAWLQSAPKALMQGAIRREWQALSKNRNAAVAPWVHSLRAGRKQSWAVLRSFELAQASPALARLAHDCFRPAEIMRTSDSAH